MKFEDVDAKDLRVALQRLGEVCGLIKTDGRGCTYVSALTVKDLVEAATAKLQERNCGKRYADADLIYEYHLLGVTAGMYGLKLSSSRTHFIIRDKRSQAMVQVETVQKAAEELERQIKVGYYELEEHR